MFAYRTEIATQFSFQSKYSYICLDMHLVPEFSSMFCISKCKQQMNRNEAKGKQHFSTIECVAQRQKALGLRFRIGHPAAARTCHVS